MKKKIFSVFFALVLVLTLALVAAPVGAAMTNVSLRAGGPAGSAEWSTDEFRTGTHSAKLSVTTGWGDDYGLVNIFFEGILLKDLPVDPTFYANGVVDNGLGPYLNILLENSEPQPFGYDPTGTYNDALEGVVATPSDNYFLGWHKMEGGGYYDADDSLDQGNAVHDLAFWQNATPDMLVVGVQILFGAMGPQNEPAQTVYIDDVDINGITYDLEPATGAVTMQASSLLPVAPFIGISVDPTGVDFGVLIPGTPSGPARLTLTNTGNVAEDFTASILNESHPPVYQNGLKIGNVGFNPQSGFLVSAWEKLNVPNGTSREQDLRLTVPFGTIVGTYTANLIFWAEAAA